MNVGMVAANEVKQEVPAGPAARTVAIVTAVASS